MNFKNKKYKKSEKVSNFLIKTIKTKSQIIKKYKKTVLHIKGFKNNMKNLSKNIIKNLNSISNNSITIINDLKISFNVYFKNKKIKSIKRRLRKKFIKSL